MVQADAHSCELIKYAPSFRIHRQTRHCHYEGCTQRHFSSTNANKDNVKISQKNIKVSLEERIVLIELSRERNLGAKQILAPICNRILSVISCASFALNKFVWNRREKKELEKWVEKTF